MNEPIVTMLYPANVEKAWQYVEPILEPAVNLAGTHTTYDVYKNLMCGNAQLWVQWNDGADAAVVTEFVNYPKGLWFRVWLMGAKGDTEIDWDNFEKMIIGFAYSNKAQSIELWGRKGWEKRYPQASKELVVLRLPLDGEKQ